jgi:hypothetical protein
MKATHKEEFAVMRQGTNLKEVMKEIREGRKQRKKW